MRRRRDADTTEFFAGRNTYEKGIAWQGSVRIYTMQLLAPKYIWIYVRGWYLVIYISKLVNSVQFYRRKIIKKIYSENPYFFINMSIKCKLGSNDRRKLILKKTGFYCDIKSL